MESGLMVLSIYCAHMAPKWNRLLELRPRQRKDMSVEVYYYEFCNWKKKLDEVNYIGFEESYIDDFLCGLKMDLMVRVWGYKWKPRTLYGAFRRAEIEETMVSWKELSRKNDAYKVFEEMSHPNSINIVASQGAADVSDEDGNAVPDASGLVEDRFRSDLPIESTLQGDKSQVNVLEDSACNMFDEMPKLIAVEPNEEINGDKIPSIDCVLQVFDSSEVTGTVATVGLMKMGSLKFAHNLFDKMLQQFSAKEKNGIEGHEKWEPSVIDFRTDLGSKTDETKFGSANSSSKMMFGEMGVFMFDPGGSSWHRVGCDSIDSNGVKQDGVAQVFDPGIGATGNVPANVSNLEEEGAIYVSRRHAFPRQMQLNGLCISNQGETGLIKSMDTQGSGLNVSRLSKTLDNHEYSAFEGEESIDDIQNVYIAKKILDVANLCHLQEVVRFVLKQDEKGNADIVLIDKDVMFYFDPGGSGSFYHLRVWEDIFEHMSRTLFEKSMEKYVDFRIAADYNHMEIALDTLFLVTNAKRNVAYTVCIDFDFGLTSNSMDVVAVLGLISGVIQRHQMGVSYYEDASRISPLNDIQADNSRKLLLRENMAYKHMNWAGTTLPRLKYTYVIEISVAAEPTYFKLGKKKKIHGYILSQGYEIHHLIMFEFLDGSCCPKLSVGVYAGLACVKGFLAIISLSQLLRIQSRHTGLDHIQSRHIARSGYVLQIFDNERYFLTDDGVILSFDPGGSSWFRMGCHHFKPNGDKQNLEFWFGEHNVDFYCTTFPADVLSFLTKCLRSQAVQQLFDKMPSTVLPIVCWLRKAKRLNGQKLLHGQEPWSSIVITQLAPKIDCIHDSARPLMIAEDVEKVLKDGLLIGDVVFGVSAKATIKEADKDDEYSPCETWLENFVWDPGQCAISVYILEDKNVFERVGKLIIPMDITWVKIEVIKDVQTICIIMGWCKIDRYLRLSCDNANDGITFVIIAGLRASLKILGRSITKEVLEITAPLEFDVVGLFWMLLCNSPWVEETRGLFASLCYDDLGVIMNSSNTMPSILGSSLVTYKIFKIRKCNRTALAKSASQLQMVPVGFSREPEDANKFNGATMDNVVWDLGLIWVSHITTLRTRWLLRGRICHDPRLKRLLENALVSVRYEFLAVSDVICDVMSIFCYSSILSYCPSSEVVKGYIN